MLGFVRRIRDALEVRRLRSQARSDGSPRGTIRLCRTLETKRRYQDAIQEARGGLKRFPYAHELADILRSSFERHRAEQAARARAEPAKNPALGDLCEVVRSYLAFARLDEAGRASRELARRFPHEAEAQLLHGIVSKALFERDHASRDGNAALQSLKRAVDLDATSLEARRSLAETYGSIGATSQAMFHVLLALEIDPNDVASNRLYMQMRRLPLQRRQERDLLWETEVHDQPLTETKALPADVTYNALLVDGVRRLATLPSVRRVAMKHRGISLVATGNRLRPASEQSDPFLASVEKIRQGASAWTKRVGVGGFEEATLTLARSTVFAVAGGGSVLALELDGEPHLARIAEEARNVVASWSSSEYRDMEWVR
jgi:tetratricopeptide (TPR) repeat protein